MNFRILNHSKDKLIINVIYMALLTYITVTMIGCSTTRNVLYSNEGMEFNEDVKIKFIMLKDSTRINTENKQVFFNDTTKSIMLYSSDTILTEKNIKLRETSKPGINDTVFIYKKVRKPGELERKIKIDDILNVYAEKTEADNSATALSAVFSIVCFITFIIIAIVF